MGGQIILRQIIKHPSQYSFGDLKGPNPKTSLNGTLKINKVCAFNLTALAMQYLYIDYLQKNGGSLGNSPETKSRHI